MLQAEFDVETLCNARCFHFQLMLQSAKRDIYGCSFLVIQMRKDFSSMTRRLFHTKPQYIYIAKWLRYSRWFCLYQSFKKRLSELKVFAIWCSVEMIISSLCSYVAQYWEKFHWTLIVASHSLDVIFPTIFFQTNGLLCGIHSRLFVSRVYITTSSSH